MIVRYIQKVLNGRRLFVVCVEGHAGFFMDTFSSIHNAREWGRDVLIAHFGFNYSDACQRIGKESAGMLDWHESVPA